ncbi:unnamed protein product, partial [Prorocentrum cordatum]
ALGPWIPQIAVLFAVPIVGGTVASSAEQVWGGDAGLHVAVIGMLLLSTSLAYTLSWATGGCEMERRAMAMEFAVKNVVFASVLLRDHFEDQATQACASSRSAATPCAGTDRAPTLSSCSSCRGTSAQTMAGRAMPHRATLSHLAEKNSLIAALTLLNWAILVVRSTL